jgi:plastocyanin
MRKLLTALFVAALLAALAVTGAQVAAGADVRAAATKPRKVVLGDDFFKPKRIEIRKGRTVKWFWGEDGSGTYNPHTVTEKNGRWSSKEKSAGTYKHKFGKKGTFRIYCGVHPEDMKMKVIVKQPD